MMPAQMRSTWMNITKNDFYSQCSSAMPLLRAVMWKRRKNSLFIFRSHLISPWFFPITPKNCWPHAHVERLQSFRRCRECSAGVFLMPFHLFCCKFKMSLARLWHTNCITTQRNIYRNLRWWQTFTMSPACAHLKWQCIPRQTPFVMCNHGQLGNTVEYRIERK